MIAGEDSYETLIAAVALAGTFAFAVSGALAAARAELDLFGVVVLGAVVGLAGGITRDLLIGVPPAAFRDWDYLAVAFAGAVTAILARPRLEAIWGGILFFDAVGLSVFCVTGASKALENGIGPLEAALLGAITGIGGGVLRDVFLDEVPTVFRHDLYALPALLGAAVFVVGERLGGSVTLFAVLGAAACLILRLLAMRFHLGLPTVARARRE